MKYFKIGDIVRLRHDRTTSMGNDFRHNINYVVVKVNQIYQSEIVIKSKGNGHEYNACLHAFILKKETSNYNIF